VAILGSDDCVTNLKGNSYRGLGNDMSGSEALLKT